LSYSASNQSLVPIPSQNLSVRGEVADDNALEPFLDKDYRDAYLDGSVKGEIALQIRSLREKFDLSQTEFAKKIGTTQSVVSRLEDTEYGGVTINTLLKVASENNVALSVRFIDYLTLLHADLKPSALLVDDVFESHAKVRHGATASAFVESASATQTTMVFIFIERKARAITWQNNPPQLVEAFNQINSPAFEMLAIGRSIQT
jgi:transcriptional regulator with XRE-family HTH domain